MKTLALVCDSFISYYIFLFNLPKMFLPMHVLSEICLAELAVFINFIYILSACFLDPLLGISLIIVFFFSSNILVILIVLAITFAKKKQNPDDANKTCFKLYTFNILAL